MKISDEMIERIREATNIVDLVGEHVRLKKRGRNYIGLCPFHNEKTPSFNVLEEKGIFKCFGCGKGGDAFTFLMELEGLNFLEAAQKLAGRANIELATEKSPEEERAQNERESLFAAIRSAAAWYYRTLRSPLGAKGMEYLRKRGLDPETIHKFGLGFAPEESGQLIAAMTKQGYTMQQLDGAGLVARGNSGDWYERFRGRVIFPVLSATGRVVGFGGRILPGGNKELAKYINSPDTSIYHKSQILYGLFYAKDAIRRKNFAILVEGYADVLAVSQAGFENVVAASGTSLTADQLNLLRRYTTSVVLLFDADQAGKNAAVRGIELAIAAGFDVSTVVLPVGEDPDSFIRLKGAAAFGDALERRQSFIETKAQWFEEQGSFDDPAQKAVALRSIVETIAKVPDRLKHPFFVHRLAQRFHISEQLLLTELENILSRERRAAQSPATAQRREREEAEQRRRDEEMGMTIKVTQPVPKPEAYILEAILADPIGVNRLFNETSFDLDLLTNPIVREIVSYLMQEVEAGEVPDIGELLADYRGREDYQQVLVECAISPTSFSDHWEKEEDRSPGEESRAVLQARQSASALMRQEIHRLRSDVMARLSRASDFDEIHALMHESLVLARRFEELKELSATELPPDDEQITD